MEIVLIYDPKKAQSHGKQARLGLLLRVGASTRGMARCLDRLVRNGPLSHFYQFELIKDTPSAEPPAGIICRIIRREEFIRPLHASDRNYKIPKRYYLIRPFVPAPHNDYMMLDRVLDGLDERIRIHLWASPVDLSTQLHALTAYLARLQSINRQGGQYDEDWVTMDLATSGDHRPLRRQNPIVPLSDKDPLADDMLQGGREIHKTLSLPHLSFKVHVTASSEPVARLVCSVLAESGFEEGSYRIEMRTCDRRLVETSAEQATSQTDGSWSSEAVEGVKEYEALRSLVGVATVDEQIGLFRLPIASSSSSPLCCRKNTDPPWVDEKDLIVLGYDAEALTGNDTPVPRGIHVSTLTKHLSCFGLPGSGKTTNNIAVIIQLAERGIPSLVLECAKKEFRALKMQGDHPRSKIRRWSEQLEIYTVGNEDVSPLRFNFLEVLVDIVEHIATVMYCIKASIPVSAGSLPALLLEALEELYEDYHERRHPPVMVELIDVIEKVLARKGYSSQTRSDMRTAIETRLEVLARGIIGKVFQCRHGISIEHLLTVSCIIELDILPADQMRLLALFLLVWIRLYLKTAPACSGKLRFVILIEEAHVIFGTRSLGGASEEVADTDAVIADVISRLLVELRALGVGIILSDQHPSALDPAATRSVGSMLAFRQVHSQDREELGCSMLFQDRQTQDIARAEPGEAFLFTEGYFGPRRIRTPNLGQHMRLTPPPTDEELFRCIRNQPWFHRATTQRISDELEQLREAVDQFEQEQQGVMALVQKLLKERRGLLAQSSDAPRTSQLARITDALCVAKRSVVRSQDRFVRGPYRRFRHATESLDTLDPPELRALGCSVAKRCQSLLKVDVPGLLRVLDLHIRNLKTHSDRR
jgi:hypothetical protein